MPFDQAPKDVLSETIASMEHSASRLVPLLMEINRNNGKRKVLENEFNMLSPVNWKYFNDEAAQTPEMTNLLGEFLRETDETKMKELAKTIAQKLDSLS